MKKTIISVFAFLSLGAVVLMQTGCSDLLEQKPQGTWLDGESAGDGRILSVYSGLKGWGITGGIPAFAIHSIRSEDVEKGSTASDGSDVAAMYDNFNYNKSDGNLLSYYSNNYKYIHVINAFLADQDTLVNVGVSLTDAQLKGRGQMLFFRAFLYFNLVRAFGEVPLFKEKITDANLAVKAKSPAVDIYAQIDEDLTMAETLLPLRWDEPNLGRVTWGAARGLHAKTYMQRNDWAKMLAASTDVINSGVYNLNTPFNQIFRESGENSSESIFELQCTATVSKPEDTDIGSQYAQVQGVRGSGQWDLGWGWNCPTQNLADAFEPGDPRKDETLLYFLKPGENVNSIPTNKPYGEKPVAGDGVVNRYYNKKVYTDPANRAMYARFGHWMNIRILRLSEMYLIAAEAANELGNTADALNYLEAVRNRARGGDNSVLPRVTTTVQSDLRDAIRRERRVELAMEWDRFYDLVRWGTAQTVFAAAGKNYQPKNALLPLPQTEVDKSNGVLIQNPNY